MNCPEYFELVPPERWTRIGQILHLFQNDSQSFVAMSSMIRSAENKGLFDKVKILPQEIDKPDSEIID